MKTHTSGFKENIKKLGRQIDSKITYTVDNEEIELGASELNSITPTYQGTLLKSVMKEIDIDSNVEIPLGTEINYQFGLKVGNSYEYLDYGNYIVNKVEKEEDMRSWKITAYDKMLYSMVDYESVGVVYPTTIRSYISALCNKLGLVFANASDTFANYNREIQNELFLTTDGDSLGYTFRDVLDQIAEVTGSIVCINNDDELELRYIKEPTPSKNLLNVSAGYTKGYLNTSTGSFVSDTYSALFNQKIPVESGKTYCLSCDWTMESLDIYLFDENDNYLRGSRVEAKKSSYNIRSTYNASYIKVGFKDGIDVMSDELISDALIMVEEGNNRTEPYEPYVNTDIDMINESYLKNINVKFGEKFGPINSIVLSRASDSDSVYLQDTESISQNGLCEIKIKENQFMNFNDRSDYLPDLLEALDGLEYYINDYSSTGVAYLELGDLYNVSIGEETYKCVMLNDTLNVSRGLSEDIYVDRPDKNETDYKKADKTDRRINQTYIIVDKQNQTITELASEVGEYDSRISSVEQSVDEIEQAISVFEDLKRNASGTSIVHLTNAVPDRPLKLSIKNVEMLYPSNTLYPSTSLYPKGSYLIIDSSTTLTESAKYYELPLQTLYHIGDVYDEFIIETNKAYIIHRIGVNNDGTTYLLDNEVIEDLGDYELTFLDGENYVYLESFKENPVIFSIDYLVHSEFTDTFATEVYVNSNITQTANQIMLQVNEKVDEDEIIAKLNVAVEDGQGIINLIGNTVTIESDNFELDAEGNVNCNNAIMNNINIQDGDITLESTPVGTRPAPSKLMVINANDNEVYTRLSSTNFYAHRYYNNSIEEYINIGAGGLSIYRDDNNSQVLINANTGIDVSKGEYSTLISNNSISTPGSVSASSFINTSLESEKKNFEKLNNALDIINNADIYSYNWKNEKKSNKKHYGLVIGDKYKTPNEFKAEDGNGIDIYSTLSICIEAIKEQQEQIEELKKEINNLKNKPKEEK